MSFTPPELVFVFLSPGVTVGATGWGVDGSGHVHRIDPNNPETFRTASAAATVLELAGTVRDANVSAQLKSLGESLLQSAAKQLRPQLAGASVQHAAS